MAFLSRAASSLLAASALFVVGCAAENSGSDNVYGGSGSDQGSGAGSGSGSGSGSGGTLAVGFTQVNLVADVAGLAPNVDPDMINAWGLAIDDQNHAFWIADNGSGKVSIVDDTGAPVALQGQTRNQDGTLVKIDLGEGITGAAKNPSATTFLMHANSGCAAARMLFSNEKGQIIAVNESIDAARGMVVVDRSAANASYKGLAIIDIKGTDQNQQPTDMFRILAPDFFNARIDVFDENFQLVNASLPTTGTTVPNAMFANPQMPAGYAPFNIAVVDNRVFVTYAKQDAQKADGLKGAGLGMVDEFDLQGNLVRTLGATGQLLNAPWGVAKAPADFCKSTANAILVGNFGDGHIIAFDDQTGRLLGELSNDQGQVLVIEGLWSLVFGDSTDQQKNVGAGNQLYFTAGPGDEAHGLFGYLTANEK